MQVGVKAPGTANMTILPFVKTSLDFFFAGRHNKATLQGAWGWVGGRVLRRGPPPWGVV